MPKFYYTAKRGPKDVVEGSLDADNRSGVLAHLAELGYVPVRISEQAPAAPAERAPARRPARPAAPSRVPASQLTTFTRQFASLVRSYVPLLRAFRILEDQARHPYFKTVLGSITEDVRQGQTLSVALGKFPAVFSPLYVNLIHSGEVSGALDAILEQLAAQLERDEMMRTKVRMALTYPGFVAGVGALTITFLMTFVMPRLSRLLEGLGSRLPAATRVLLAISGAMTNPWFWAGLAAAGGGAWLLWRALGERGRMMRDRWLMRVPVLGPLVLQAELARFARSFGLQINHGISILQAIEVANLVVTHRVVRAQFGRLPEELRQGNTLSSALRGTSVASAFLINTVAVGEESGKVGEALTEVAAYYERETERLLQTLATLLEPMLIVTVGVIVGFIVMAVLLPIFEMSSLNP